jgi:hypothetical protein
LSEKEPNEAYKRARAALQGQMQCGSTGMMQRKHHKDDGGPEAQDLSKCNKMT